MRSRSTLWFILAAAWGVLLVLNIPRHRDKNTLVIGIAVAVFLAMGAAYRHSESRNKKLK